jgi:hypothetical protein
MTQSLSALVTAAQRITKTADTETRMVAPVAVTDTVAATHGISRELTNNATISRSG